MAKGRVKLLKRQCFPDNQRHPSCAGRVWPIYYIKNGTMRLSPGRLTLRPQRAARRIDLQHSGGKDI